LVSDVSDVSDGSPKGFRFVTDDSPKGVSLISDVGFGKQYREKEEKKEVIERAAWAGIILKSGEGDLISGTVSEGIRSKTIVRIMMYLD
jgi:hypothetical protein